MSFYKKLVVDGPIFENGCEHEEDEYVGSIIYDFNDKGEPRYIDVYAFQGGLWQELCIRYGNKDHEYFAPSSILMFLSSAQTMDARKEYEHALELLKIKGEFEYHKK